MGTTHAAVAAAVYAVLEVAYYAGDAGTFTDSFPRSDLFGGVLLLSGLLFCTQLVAMLPFFAASLRWPARAKTLLPIVPSVVVAGMAVMLLERMLDPAGAEAALSHKVAWRLGPAVLGLATYFRLRATVDEPLTRWTKLPGPALLTLCALWTLARWLPAPPAGYTPLADMEPTSRPHVILLAADGIESRSLTPYGSPLDTTPYLNKLADESIVYENAFVNSGKTTGSTTSMLSGVHPLESKVMFPPQVLAGAYSHRHLPRILREWGYTGIQRSVRFYADAEDLNMVGAFDVANGRDISTLPRLGPLRSVALAVNDELYLGRRLRADLVETLYTFATGVVRVDAFRDVGGDSEIDSRADRAVLEEALAYLDEADGPVLMHLHLLGTHCCTFHPLEDRYTVEDAQKFSGPIRNEKTRARYLSTVSEFDDNVAFFVEELRARGQLDNTLLIVSSDHSAGWRAMSRVPLIVRAPNAAVTGRVTANVQLLSVPATVLQHVGVPRAQIPSWMHDEALPLPGEQAPEPLILSIDDVALSTNPIEGFAMAKDGTMGHRQIEAPGPPEYGVGTLGVVRCNHFARFKVAHRRWFRGTIKEHTSPCAVGFGRPELKDILLSVDREYGVTLRRKRGRSGLPSPAVKSEPAQ
ncbi:MAG: sulfatase-like hydrolase/transferase [Proteobacteria bacterium]|nr:sulfatase-like hydrolase/transferase [Pseudomonadota bacterium]